MTRYLVNEIYPCLQGEGPNIGLPAVLLRFQICNLRCTWCDTPYTHTLHSDPVETVLSEDLKTPSVSVRERQRFFALNSTRLAEKVKDTGNGIKHLILTGGEPTLHNLVPLMNQLGDDFSAEVESNGTLIPHEKHPEFKDSDYSRFQWNISPKGKNAGCEFVHESLKHWSALSKEASQRVWFKWVVRANQFEEDIEEIEFLKKKHGIPSSRVVLMPEGTSPESQLGRTRIAEYCQSSGYRYTPRLHVLLYGDKRGF